MIVYYKNGVCNIYERVYYKNSVFVLTNVFRYLKMFVECTNVFYKIDTVFIYNTNVRIKNTTFKYTRLNLLTFVDNIRIVFVNKTCHYYNLQMFVHFKNSNQIHV